MTAYRTAVVSYLDILGFRDLIEQSLSNPARVDEILDILRILKKASSAMGSRGQDENGNPIFYTDNFSDTLIRTTFRGSLPFVKYVDAELMILSGIQTELITSHRVLVRGGVSVGPFYRDDEQLFGPALVESYILGEKIASYPRIMISDSVMQIKKEYEHTPDSFLTTYVGRDDEDGKYFVDYLNGSYRDWMLTSDISASQADEMLAAHKIAVEHKLKEFSSKNEAVQKKGHWLVQYHNSTTRRLIEESPFLKSRLMPLLIDIPESC